MSVAGFSVSLRRTRDTETSVAATEWIYNRCVSNVRRLLVTDRIFFVTVNLQRGIPHFSEGEFPLLIQALQVCRERTPFLLCGYVLMPDHWHALICTQYPVTVSRTLQDVKWLSARLMNRHRGSKGSIWQRRFWDRFVRHKKEFCERLDYMHLNPVNKSLVARPDQWRWSSYNNFAIEKSVVESCHLKIDYVDWSDQNRG